MIKRVLFLTVGILSLMLAACETKAINNGKKENKMKTIELTKADFLKKIVDYEKNPEEWIYLGDKPAIIDFYASSFLFIPMNDKPQMAMGAMPKSSFKEAIDGVLLKK